MDFFEINILIAGLSATLMMAGIVYILYYVLGSFSSKSGAQSMRVFLFSLFYFFGSAIPILMGVEWLTQLARTRAETGQPFFLNLGAGALGLNALVHFFCGFITILLYLRGHGSLGLTLQRFQKKVLNLILSKSKH